MSDVKLTGQEMTCHKMIANEKIGRWKQRASSGQGVRGRPGTSVRRPVRVAAAESSGNGLGRETRQVSIDKRADKAR